MCTNELLGFESPAMSDASNDGGGLVCRRRATSLMSQAVMTRWICHSISVADSFVKVNPFRSVDSEPIREVNVKEDTLRTFESRFVVINERRHYSPKCEGANRSIHLPALPSLSWAHGTRRLAEHPAFERGAVLYVGIISDLYVVEALASIRLRSWRLRFPVSVWCVAGPRYYARGYITKKTHQGRNTLCQRASSPYAYAVDRTMYLGCLLYAHVIPASTINSMRSKNTQPFPSPHECYEIL